MTAQIMTADGPIDAPERVLLVVAHPDDIDFGSAGTVATLTDAGSHVAYCLVTSGDAGDDDLTVTREELIELREGEQTAAGKCVGVTDIHWLRYPDGRVESTLDLRRDISRVIRIERPNVVIGQSPEINYDRIFTSHPDHLAVGRATFAAVYPDSRNPRAFPELLDEGHQPHTVDECWLTGLKPNLHIDTTDVFPRKVEALRAHRSQTEKMGDRLPELLSEWARTNAVNAGFGEDRYAEGFRRVNAT